MFCRLVYDGASRPVGSLAYTCITFVRIYLQQSPIVLDALHQPYFYICYFHLFLLYTLHNTKFIKCIPGFHAFLYLLQDNAFATRFLQSTSKHLFFYLTRHHTYTVNISHQHITIVYQHAFNFDRYTIVNHLSARSLILSLWTVRKTRKI